MYICRCEKMESQCSSDTMFVCIWLADTNLLSELCIHMQLCDNLRWLYTFYEHVLQKNPNDWIKHSAHALTRHYISNMFKCLNYLYFGIVQYRVSLIESYYFLNDLENYNSSSCCCQLILTLRSRSHRHNIGEHHFDSYSYNLNFQIHRNFSAWKLKISFIA